MKIIRIALIALIISSSTLASISAQAAVNWRIAETWPKDFPLFGDAVKKMIKNVDELSNGQFKITSVTKETHKKPLGIFELVQDGEFEMGHSASYYWKDRDVNTTFFTTVPMGMVATEQHAWFYHGGGMELMQSVYGKYGMLSFPGGNTGNQMGGWFKKEITKVDDLKGLRMRIPGIAGEVMQELGVETVNIPAGELYKALEAGELDALEWVGPSLDLGMRFHEIANHYYTGWHEPATELQFLVNQKAFDDLSDSLKNILIVSMRLAAYDTYVEIYHQSAENLAIMRAQFPDLKIRSFPSSVYRALVRASAKRVDELVSEGDELTKRIVDSQRSYSKKVRLWTRFSDQAYLNNAF